MIGYPAERAPECSSLPHLSVKEFSPAVSLRCFVRLGEEVSGVGDLTLPRFIQLRPPGPFSGSGLLMLPKVLTHQLAAAAFGEDSCLQSFRIVADEEVTLFGVLDGRF